MQAKIYYVCIIVHTYIYIYVCVVVEGCFNELVLIYSVKTQDLLTTRLIKTLERESNSTLYLNLIA